jgi:coxsackievirus/adenovirus receptor
MTFIARKSSNGDESPCNQITCEFGSICIERIKVLTLAAGSSSSTGSASSSNIRTPPLIHPLYTSMYSSFSSTSNTMKVILPECSCPDKCSHYFSSNETSKKLTPLESKIFIGGQSEDTPVCGSDGMDYSSLCQLKKKSCQDKTNISVKFIGKCGESSDRVYTAWVMTNGIWKKSSLVWLSRVLLCIIL